ncbi:MAG TPA: aminotransferase class V-fold PLP-dependent enzyme [Candidatus Aminicenantes bacterium]|nr:aminotransferase class V-fold PLP-dependent enzyme [Candidatus Aminicenantes bacterium]
MKPDELRKEFPVLTARRKGKLPVYFDNACMTLKPLSVTNAMMDYYHGFPGCHGRADHDFAARTSTAFAAARSRLQRFFNARSPNEIVFLRNATEGLNVLSRGIAFAPGDSVLTSELEHNSNLIPWQWAEKHRGIRRIVIPTLEDTGFDMRAFERAMDGSVKLVSLLHTSNVTGVTFPISEIVSIARKHGSLVCLDVAQSVLHQKVDVRRLGVDFMVASMHKMMGPTGMGVLYGRLELLKALDPHLTGGDTVIDSTLNHYVPAEVPQRFEAGLQDYAGAIGAAAAADLVDRLGHRHIHRHLVELNRHITDRLSEFPGVRILGPKDAVRRAGICNLILKGMDAMDTARLLNESAAVMVRPGRHCAHAFFNRRGLSESLRFSFGPYNTVSEVDQAVEAFANIHRLTYRA